ncbi:MAG TPA: hypothetical protein PLP42_02800 [Acidobacteriota bacterium]|nr:hypothetical protein [Acidobacteriota bacterium]
MLYRSLILLILLGFIVLPVTGERAFTTIQPNNGTDITYRFDTNSVPEGSSQALLRYLGTTPPADLNHPPNIVFTPDSAKGFVSFPGSDKILAFRPSTGEILATIETSRNPGMISMTPDGQTIAVPCLFLKENTEVIGETIGRKIGAINLIDVNTYAVRTIDLTEVFFAFANNIIFSADSKTGFIASSGTHEILRFDVETATLIDRLFVGPGSNPASLAMAPDYSFFTVVLTAWRFPQTHVPPDTVAFIDPTTFQVIRKLDMNFEGNTQVVDFRAVNTVAFTSDGKYGLIGDQLASSLDSTFSTQDRAFLFETATGKIVKVFSVGNQVGGAYTMPDGFRFVLIGQIHVSIVDTRLLESSTTTPVFADFKPANRPAFSPDGKRMFLSVPITDRLLVFNIRSGELLRAIDIGTRVNPLEEDHPFTQAGITGAPLELAMTPDGKILAAVNFNSNTIDLIRDTKNFTIPHFYSRADWFTGVALTNNSATTEAKIHTNGYSFSGTAYVDTESTTDVVEYTNPNTITLAPGTQTAFTAADLLKPASDKTVDGWLDVDSDVFETTGFFMVGDTAIKRIDGAPIFTQAASSVIIPEIRVSEGFRTELTVFNYSYTALKATVKLYNDEGELVATSDTIDLLGLMQNTSLLKDPDGTGDLVGLFSDEDLEGFTDGYAVVESDFPILAIQRYYDSERMSMLHGVPKGPGFNSGTRFFVPQVAAFDGSQTLLNLINAGAETLTVTAVMKDSAGVPIGAPATFQLGAGKHIRRDIVELFQLVNPATTVAGWVQIDTDKPGLVGDAEIRAYNGKAMTTLSLASDTGRTLTFSHFAEGLGYSTGISLVNPGGLAATTQIEIFKPDGSRIAGKDVIIPAGGRFVHMLTDPELFPSLANTVGGYVRVTSDQPLVGVEIFFTNNLELLSLVPGQIVAE